MEQYLQREGERFEEFARENRDGERDEALLDGDEPDLLENPIVEHYEHDPDAFFTLCGFDIGHFDKDVGAMETVMDPILSIHRCIIKR
jgi:3-polyprenyl-4-hydroxybenzoate decarboxylase